MELFIVVFITLLCLAFIVANAKSAKKNQKAADKEDLFPYIKQSHLLSPAELSFYHTLKLGLIDQCDINIKIRLADLLSVHDGLDKSRWWKAFNQLKAKHIDFVLTDKMTSQIFCAIELDDKSHQQTARIKRDAFVDKACQAAKLPIIRFDAQASYSSSEILHRINHALPSPSYIRSVIETAAADTTMADKEKVRL